MTDRYVLLREPGKLYSHIPAPDDDASTLCGENADEMEPEETRADQSAFMCGACMKEAVK